MRFSRKTFQFRGKRPLQRSQEGDAEDHPGSSRSHDAASPREAPPDTSHKRLKSTAGKEWVDWKLRWPWFALIMFMQLGTAITIIVLAHLSAVRSGWISLPLASGPGTGLFSRSSLWTVVPSLLIVLYQRVLMDSVTKSFVGRQPFVEMKRDGGAPAYRTILVDYAAESSFSVWVIMLRNGHFFLGVISLWSLLCSFVLGPFASNIFQAAEVSSNSTVTLQELSVFNSSLYNASTDFQSTIAKANAAMVQGASFPSWTVPNAALPELSINYTDPSTHVSSYRVAVTAESAELECQPYGESFTLSDMTASFNLTDRGCVINHKVPISSDRTTSIQGWETSNCSKAHGWNRMNLLATVIDPSSQSLTASAFITCIPRYKSSNGTLSILNGTLGFTGDPNTSTDLDPENGWLASYPNDLLEPQDFDPAKEFAGSDFAGLIYDYSRSVVGNGDPLAPAALVKATEETFQGVFSIFMGTQLRQSLGPSAEIPVPATETFLQTRLFVYNPMAYTVMAILFVSFWITGHMFWYTFRHRSSQLESCKGLAGYAMILKGSDVFDLVDDAVAWSESPQTKHTPGTINASFDDKRFWRDKRWQGDWAVGSDRRVRLLRYNEDQRSSCHDLQSQMREVE